MTCWTFENSIIYTQGGDIYLVHKGAGIDCIYCSINICNLESDSIVYNFLHHTPLCQTYNKSNLLHWGLVRDSGKWKDRKNTGIADMNVEKLREVGQKIGYEGEELNEFIEEQLAYQLEEERLDAEEREA